MNGPATTTDRPLRRDAARNRELILETAAGVFAEYGLDAGYDEIARRAGVGVGTVYRRFPERAELVRALFESSIDDVVAIATEAAADPDPWAGLVSFLEQAVLLQVSNRGLQEVMFSTVSPDERQTIGRERIGPVIEALVARAHADGRLRRDVQATDLGMQLMMLSSMSSPGHPDLWRRYLALALDGMRARPDLTELPLAAPPDEAMHDALGQMRRR